MIVTVTPNPAVDHMLFVGGLNLHDANRVLQVDCEAGGKGVNASRVIAGLGGHTVVAGFFGGGTGAYVRHVLAEEGVPHHFTRINGDTRINFSVEDGSGFPPTCFNEPGPTINADEVESLIQFLEERLKVGSWLLVAGSLPPGTSPELIGRLGRLARKKSAKFAVDADSEGLKVGIAAGPSFLKPNVREAERLLGRRLDSLETLIGALGDIRSMSPDTQPVVVISRGSDGAVMLDDEGIWIGESPEIEVRSTVGSGDSMVGAMLFAMDRGMAPSEALALGMAAGAATAALVGSGLATRTGVERLLPRAQVRRTSVPARTRI